MFVKLFLFSGIFRSLLTGTGRTRLLIYCLMDYFMTFLLCGYLFWWGSFDCCWIFSGIQWSAVFCVYKLLCGWWLLFEFGFLQELPHFLFLDFLSLLVTIHEPLDSTSFSG
jgi:hypothetical protein